MSFLGRVMNAIAPLRVKVREQEDYIEILRKRALDQAERIIELEKLTGLLKKADNDMIDAFAHLEKRHLYLDGHVQGLGIHTIRSLKRLEKIHNLEHLKPDPNMQVVKKGQLPPPEIQPSKKRRDRGER